MRADARRKARLRLDERLQSLKPVDRLAVPPKGWVRAIRDVLGMTGAQLSRRLGTTPQSVEALERSEAAGSIKIGTLRRAAEALDCTLVYALVPNKPLEKMVKDRARLVALRDFGRVSHSMKLEAQQTDDADLEARIEAYTRDGVSLRDLWDVK